MCNSGRETLKSSSSYQIKALSDWIPSKRFTQNMIKGFNVLFGMISNQSCSVFVYSAWFKLPDQIWMKSILFSKEILLEDP